MNATKLRRSDILPDDHGRLEPMYKGSSRFNQILRQKGVKPGRGGQLQGQGHKKPASAGRAKSMRVIAIDAAAAARRKTCGLS